MTKIKFINSNLLIRLIIKITSILLFFTIIYMIFDNSHWNGISENDDNTFLNRFINRLYFTSTTLSTVGYGDITPVSNSSKIVTIFLHIVILITVVEYIRIEFKNNK